MPLQAQHPTSTKSEAEPQAVPYTHYNANLRLTAFPPPLHRKLALTQTEAKTTSKRRLVVYRYLSKSRSHLG